MCFLAARLFVCERSCTGQERILSQVRHTISIYIRYVILAYMVLNSRAGMRGAFASRVYGPVTIAARDTTLKSWAYRSRYARRIAFATRDAFPCVRLGAETTNFLGGADRTPRLARVRSVHATPSSWTGGTSNLEVGTCFVLLENYVQEHGHTCA